MKNRKIAYIGSFPPPYGGVTVKNALLYKNLEPILKMKKIDLTQVKKLKLRAICDLARCIFSRSGSLILGVSAGWRYRLTSILYCLNRNKMGRSVLVVMGGKIPESVAYAERMNGYRRVYVETESMKRMFERMGANNVAVYPNCREKPLVPIKINQTKGGHSRMSVVFFSLISPNKGARIVLGSAKALPQIDFHFYGRIEKGYENEFLTEVAECPNVSYHGVFDSVIGDVVGELNKYDIHVFPTLCPNEGVPGVIAETMMAGIPTIASNRSYNGELIEDGVNGVLTHDDTPEELARVLVELSNDPKRVDHMKLSALESAQRYEIDKYLNQIAGDLSDNPEVN